MVGSVTWWEKRREVFPVTRREPLLSLNVESPANLWDLGKSHTERLAVVFGGGDSRAQTEGLTLAKSVLNC